MTPIDPFERHLPAALTDLADPRTPDYFTDILGLTARTRQRPAWASIERWLPMDITTQRVPMAGIPWRQLGILALLALLLTAALVVVGSRMTAQPAPLFGPAANGLIPFSIDGDLFTGDPVTGEVRSLLDGPTFDDEPTFTRDGLRLAFSRRVDPADASTFDIFMMDPDGSDLVKVTGAPLVDPHWWDLSPDGRHIVTVSSGQVDGTFQLWPTDGRGVATTPVPDLQVDVPVFRPPDSNEILFRGRDGVAVGLYVVNLDGSDLRPIIEPASSSARDFTLREPRYSPDGSRIAVQAWDDSTRTMRLYVMNADGTDRRELGADRDISFTGWPAWSNDGTRLAVQRHRADSQSGVGLPYAVIDVRDGSVIETGPALPADGGRIEWAPDDSAILLVPNEPDARQILLDPAGGPVTELAWEVDTFPTWQRKAP